MLGVYTNIYRSYLPNIIYRTYSHHRNGSRTGSTTTHDTRASLAINPTNLIPHELVDRHQFVNKLQRIPKRVRDRIDQTFHNANFKNNLDLLHSIVDLS